MLKFLTQLLTVILAVLLGALIVRVLLGGGGINPASTQPPALPNPAVASLEPLSEVTAAPVVIPTINNARRTTILLLGTDRRSSAESYTLTDTILLMSIDPAEQSASLLSIPRDLYVEIPGYGKHRINAAFILGQQEGGDAAGAELAMRTVEQNLGVSVDHYALVGFDVVVNLVDAVGGVTVRVPQRIDDPLYPDMNYGYDPFVIEEGEQLLDGETALKYMRSRHGSSDFNRALRQQQVVLAYRDTLMDQGVTDMLQLAPSLLEKFSDGFFTDLTTSEILGYARASTDLASFRISSAVLDYNYVVSQATPTQGTVLIPLEDEVTELLQQLFN